MNAWKKYIALPNFRNCALQAFDTKMFRNVVKTVLTFGFISYGLSAPDVLPNFPVRCLRLHRILMFNELKQKRMDCQWIVAVFGFTVVSTATEMSVDFLTVLIHTWWVTVQNIIRWLFILRISWIFHSFQESAGNQFTAACFHMFIILCSSIMHFFFFRFCMI